MAVLHVTTNSTPDPIVSADGVVFTLWSFSTFLTDMKCNGLKLQLHSLLEDL